MPGLLGKKIGMTSVFSAEGKNVPCTVIELGPCVVTQIKSVEKDGYNAVQLGYEEAKEKNTTAPLMGHFKKAGVTPKRHLAEFKIFYNALEIVKTKMASEEKDSLTIWKEALDKITPQVEVKSRRIGGATFQVPTEIRPDRKESICKSHISTIVPSSCRS